MAEVIPRDSFLFKALVISIILHIGILCVAVFKWSQRPVKPPTPQPVKVQMRQVVVKPTTLPDNRLAPLPNMSMDLAAQQIGVKSLKDVTQTASVPAMPLGVLADNTPRRSMPASTAMSKKTVMITPIKNEKIDNPAYAAYNEMVRSRIEEKVYHNYDLSASGVVYLTFIVSKEGHLQAYQVIADRTQANQTLIDASLKSLEEASPFPEFLANMNLPAYTFNIEIQYQLGD